ncbi:MAG: ASCH domain-containing protein [Actinomycetaceae bacterium]|nr:ASCH domain-containing protein [Actinomycetaceae bacterium]
MPEPIYTSAVVFQREDGAVLTARKQGTNRFMLIGGKPEPGETPRLTALREVQEEVGINLEPSGLEFIGMWRTAAANEAGREVHGTAFRATHPLVDLPAPAAEIAELKWLTSVEEDPADLAPLLVTRILPALGWSRGKWCAANPLPVAPWDCDHLPVVEYGKPGPMRSHLTKLIVEGKKVATSSRLADYRGSELAQVGTMERLCAEDGHLLGVVETQEVRVVPLAEVTDEFALAEGEGFTDAAQWRHAHEWFWGGGQLPDDELIVTERIRFHRAQ